MTDMTTPTVQGNRTGMAQPNPELRQTSWGVLGSSLDGTATRDPREALDRAGLLGWNVHRRPLETSSILDTEDGGHELVNPLVVPDYFASVRDTPQGPAVLGVVGARYVPIQNEEYLPLFDAVMANEPDAEVTAAGALRGGARAFVALRLPALDLPVGGDPVDMYLVGQNSHDGSSAFHFALTPVRLFCTNQLRGIKLGKGVQDRWVIRHTRSYRDQLDQVTHVLAESRQWAARFSQDAEALLRTQVTDAMFREVLEDLWPEPGKKAGKAAVTRHEARMDTLDTLWRDSVTIPDEVRGTGWGMFNVVTEYMDHYQAAGVGRGYSAEEARADRNLVGRDEAIKSRAWEAVMSLV